MYVPCSYSMQWEASNQNRLDEREGTKKEHNFSVPKTEVEAKAIAKAKGEVYGFTVCSVRIG